jgi:hypothetical protein
MTTQIRKGFNFKSLNFFKRKDKKQKELTRIESAINKQRFKKIKEKHLEDYQYLSRFGL